MRSKCMLGRAVATVALLGGAGCGGSSSGSASVCQPDACPCAQKATPDKIVTEDFVTQNLLFAVAVPYGQADCPDRYVYEVPIAGSGAADLWLSTLWSDLDIDTEQECNDETIFVEVFRRGGDEVWQRWDSYRVLGVWQNAHCRTRFQGGGRQSAAVGSNPNVGFPWSWVDLTGGIQTVRAAVGGGTPGQLRPLNLAVADSSL